MRWRPFPLISSLTRRCTSPLSSRLDYKEVGAICASNGGVFTFAFFTSSGVASSKRCDILRLAIWDMRLEIGARLDGTFSWDERRDRRWVVLSIQWLGGMGVAACIIILRKMDRPGVSWVFMSLHPVGSVSSCPGPRSSRSVPGANCAGHLSARIDVYPSIPDIQYNIDLQDWTS